MARYRNSGFGIRDLTKENHWDENIQNFKITKPTFISLGGNGTINTHFANGSCSRMERLMGLKPKYADIYSTYKDVDLIGFYYGIDNEKDTHGSVSRNEIAYFVEKLLVPLCLNPENNRALPLEQVCVNFSRLIFFTHCYGAVVVNDMMEYLRKKLLIKGFSEEDINTIYSQAVNIAYSPLEDDYYLPTIKVNSFCDSFNITTDLKEWFIKKYGYKLDGVAIYNELKDIAENNKNENQKVISIYSSKLINLKTNKENLIDEHLSECVDLNEKWMAGKKSGGAKNSECVSRIVGYSLAYAGARALNIHKSNSIMPLNLNNLENNLKDVLESYKAEDLEAVF